MFRGLIAKSVILVRHQFLCTAATPVRRFASRTGTITDAEDDEVDCKYEMFFNRPDIDAWEVRKGMSDMHGMDLVPDPKTIIAALRACRRINDYALAVRHLEAIKFKCGDNVGSIYPYILQEINPTLAELGIETPEQMGYGKPEFVVKSVYES